MRGITSEDEISNLGFWTEDKLRNSNAFWMVEASIDYLSSLYQSDHEGVLVLPEDAEVIRVHTTSNGSVFFFVKAPYPTFLGLVRHVSLEEKMKADKESSIFLTEIEDAFPGVSDEK